MAYAYCKVEEHHVTFKIIYLNDSNKNCFHSQLQPSVFVERWVLVEYFTQRKRQNWTLCASLITLG